MHGGKSMRNPDLALGNCERHACTRERELVRDARAAAVATALYICTYVCMFARGRRETRVYGSSTDAYGQEDGGGGPSVYGATRKDSDQQLSTRRPGVQVARESLGSLWGLRA